MANVKKDRLAQAEVIDLLRQKNQDLQDYLFGKITPVARQAEEAVLGACISTDHENLTRAVRNLKAADFHLSQHQTVFTAIESLVNSGGKTDLITVTETIAKAGLLGDRSEPPAALSGRKKTRFVEFAISPYEIVELSRKAGLTSHIESHCRIIKEQSMRRAIIRSGFRLLREAQDPSCNIHNLCQNVTRNLRYNSPESILKTQSMTNTMTNGSQIQPAKKILGSLLRENEVAIWFSDPGTGKSVFGFQIADAASRGVNVFPEVNLPELKNECAPKETLVFDFELEDSEIFARYSAEGKHKQFHERFKRVSINENFLNFENSDNLILAEITSRIEVHKPQLVIIDNITYISSESQDPKVATSLMKRLLAIQKSNPGMTILVIAHTPKRDISQPLELNNLAGAKNLSNFAKSVVAIGKSFQDKAVMRYIKHVKCRNGRLHFSDDNVLEVSLQKEGVDLRYEYQGIGKEKDHLTVFDTSAFHEEMMNYVKQIKENTDSGWRKITYFIKKKYSVSWSHSTLRRKYIAWTESNKIDSTEPVQTNNENTLFDPGLNGTEAVVPG